MRPILVVDCYVEGDGTSNFRRLLNEYTLETWRALVEPRPKDVLDYAAIVISGSAACVTAPEPWMDEVVELILDAKATGVPVLGICFGHQMVAYALYGPQAVRKSSTPEIGWTDIEVLRDTPLFEGLGNPFNTFESHFDEVVACPGMTVLARSERCEVQSFKADDGRIWGVQFHAEMDLKEAVELSKIRIGGRPDLGFDIAEKLKQAKDSTDLATRLFANFLGEQ